MNGLEFPFAAAPQTRGLQGRSNSFEDEQRIAVEKARAEVLKSVEMEHQKVMASDPRPTAFARFVDGKPSTNNNDIQLLRGHGQRFRVLGEGQ